ncbi:MAG: hypothetical protein ACXVRZ_07630 [Gaiellaceae bacterium]
MRWARISGGRSGCWFAICPCGMPAVHFPLRPEHEPADPVSAALGPAHAPLRPPWIRVFQLTSGYPWWLPWRHLLRACPGCRQRVTFAVWTRLAGGRSAYSALCLACGHATSEYLGPSGGRMREAPVSGRDWSPPCVAVARLRRAVFSPPPD